MLDAPKWVNDVKKEVAVDQNSPRKECMFYAPTFFHNLLDPHLADPRDALMLDLLFNITLLVLPSAVLQFNLPEALEGWSTQLGH